MNVASDGEKGGRNGEGWNMGEGKTRGEDIVCVGVVKGMPSVQKIFMGPSLADG